MDLDVILVMQKRFVYDRVSLNTFLSTPINTQTTIGQTARAQRPSPMICFGKEALNRE